MPAFGPGNIGSWGQGSLSQEDREEIKIEREKVIQHLVTCNVAHLFELREKLIQLEKQRKLKCPKLIPNRIWQSIMSDSDIGLLDKVIKAIQEEKSPTTQTIVNALWQPDCDASLWIKEIEKRTQGITLENQEMQCLKKTV